MKLKTILTLALSVLALSGMAQSIMRSSNGNYGVAVNKGTSIAWVIKPDFLIIEKSNGAYLVCDMKGKWGVYNSDGKKVFNCIYSNKKEAKEAYDYKVDPTSRSYVSNGQKSKNSSNPNFTLTRNYTDYIRSYVEREINKWQTKGEFEKTADYQARVTEATRNAKINELTRRICEECLDKVSDKELRMTLGEYDADHESFLIHSEIGDFVVPVPYDRAQEFKNNWYQITSRNTYDIVNGKIVMRATDFLLKNKVIASYDNKTRTPYAQAVVNYNFDAIQVPMTASAAPASPVITTTTIDIGKSDVDMNIPAGRTTQDNTFALIIANENYKNEANVPFALNDGRAVESYFTKTLGINPKNVHTVYDASKNEIITEIANLHNISQAENGNIKLLVYYTGHGVPDDKTLDASLVPSDGTVSIPVTLIKMSDFYDAIGMIETQSTVIFLDACFSGALRGEGTLWADARGIARVPKEEIPKENIIVISAAQGNETAWPYHEKSHGLFTYFLLKKLQDTKGDVTLGDLTSYVQDQVKRHSTRERDLKTQTPTINVSYDMVEKWREMKLN